MKNNAILTIEGYFYMQNSERQKGKFLKDKWLNGGKKIK